MNKPFYVRKLILTLVILGVSYLSCLAQEERPPKSFAGIFAGIEWNTLSGSWGVEYEQVVFTQRKLTVGVKAAYVAKYAVGNMELLSSSHNNEKASHLSVLGTTSYYFGSRENFSGLFMHAGLGVGVGWFKYIDQGTTTNSLTRTRPAAEFGPGWQFRVGDRFALRCKATASFGSFTGAFTSTTVALGF